MDQQFIDEPDLTLDAMDIFRINHEIANNLEINIQPIARLQLQAHLDNHISNLQNQNTRYTDLINFSNDDAEETSELRHFHEIGNIQNNIDRHNNRTEDLIDTLNDINDELTEATDLQNEIEEEIRQQTEQQNAIPYDMNTVPITPSTQRNAPNQNNMQRQNMRQS